MFASPPLSVTERFAARMVELRKVLVNRSVSFGQSIMGILLTMDYLRRADVRFERLMQRFRAGKLAPPVPRKPQPRRERAKAAGDPPAKRQRMSRALGWFAKMIPPDGYYYADHLREILADPETRAAMAAGPQVARLFRPICQMFGVKDESIALPRRARTPRPPTPEQSERQAAREEAKRQRELAKTSSKKSVVPKGHTYPVTERDWAIWARRNRRNERRWRTAKRKTA